MTSGASATRAGAPPAAVSPTGVPRLRGESGLRFVRDGYLFGIRGFRDAGADAFRTRLLGRRVVVARGAEAAHVFGATRFRRPGALPRSTMRLLQDEGSVQALEGRAHRERKALMLAMARDDRARLVLLFRDEVEEALRARRGSRVAVLELGSAVLFRAALDWVGADAGRDDPRLLADVRAMIDRAASIGPVNWAARVRRRRAERWATDQVIRARERGDRESPVGRIAHHEEMGMPLPLPVAAVELLNLVRPVVAVGRFLAFAAHALVRHPAWEQRIRSEDGVARWFAEEVRRFYPFFPLIGGIADEPFDLGGERFGRGQWMLLDLYGTDHDPGIWPDPSVFDPQRFADERPHPVVAQGVGDPLTAHRCPGEDATTDLIAAAVDVLARTEHRVPDQDLRISLRRLPTAPADGMILDLR
ncbi:cytochrome P450 [Microbacterium resistens]|uniref:cytochrome P450 n=1 Tax=Microbacterium resistens TaxID=156977 RepID=UPI00082BD9C4|nr:cytochrome P450 [Microbacterium resistens]